MALSRKPKPAVRRKTPKVASKRSSAASSGASTVAMTGDLVYLDGNPADMTEEGIKQRLIDWWMRQADKEVQAVAPKALEYGAADLKIMGQGMLHLMPQEGGVPMMDGREATIIDGMQMAVAFYALGKVARLFGAYEKGKRPNPDSWHDLSVYCRMNLYISDFERWP